MKTRNLGWWMPHAGLAIAAMVILIILSGCGPRPENGATVIVTGDDNQVVVQSDVPCCEEQTAAEQAAEVPAAEWGPEQALPGTIEGPAIGEIWDGAEYCALVRVNTGESLEWSNPGAWWQAPDQTGLEVRWPHHKAEYMAKDNSADCEVIENVNDVPSD